MGRAADRLGSPRPLAAIQRNNVRWCRAALKPTPGRCLGLKRARPAQAEAAQPEGTLDSQQQSFPESAARQWLPELTATRGSPSDDRHVRPGAQDGWIDGLVPSWTWSGAPSGHAEEIWGETRARPDQRHPRRLGALGAVPWSPGWSAEKATPCWSSSADTGPKPCHFTTVRLVAQLWKLARAESAAGAARVRSSAGGAATWCGPNEARLALPGRALAPHLLVDVGGGPAAAGCGQAGAVAAGPGVDRLRRSEGACPPCWPLACRSRDRMCRFVATGGRRPAWRPETACWRSCSPGLSCS